MGKPLFANVSFFKTVFEIIHYTRVHSNKTYDLSNNIHIWISLKFKFTVDYLIELSRGGDKF